MPRKYRYKLIDYGIDNDRQDELKAICRQYEKLKNYQLDNYDIGAAPISGMPKGTDISDPTYKRAEKIIAKYEKVKAIEQAAIKADAGLYRYIILNACYDFSYNDLVMSHNIPVGYANFYESVRLFFIHLDRMIV